MPRFDIFDTVDDLRATGQSFVIATVLRTADVTSAKAGAKAAVTADGDILGHLGGACVQRAVRDAAAGALDLGEPRVIRVKPSDKVVAMHDPDGVQTYKSGCPSGGTVDVLIEPYQLPPKLVLFGATPISRAIAAHAGLMGLSVWMPAGVDAGAASVQSFDDIANIPLTARDFVVVAAQGQSDLAALRAAVQSPARRISMVASRRKADVLSQKLIDAGENASAVARLKSPAGLDIKGVDPHEIALSVLAEITLWRNTDAAPVTQEAVDEKLA